MNESNRRGKIRSRWLNECEEKIDRWPGTIKKKKKQELGEGVQVRGGGRGGGGGGV